MSLLPKDKDQAVVNLVAALIDRILSEIVQDKQRFDPPDTSNLVLKSGVAQRNQSERKKSGMEAIYHHKVSFITFLLVAGASLVVKTDNVNMIGLKNVLDKAFQDKEIFGECCSALSVHLHLLSFHRPFCAPKPWSRDFARFLGTQGTQSVFCSVATRFKQAVQWA